MKRFSDYVSGKIPGKGTHRNVTLGKYRICKRDKSAHRVFGYAIMGTDNSIENAKGYSVTGKDMEMAIYEFMLSLQTKETGQPASIIESCVFTSEKQRAMGIPQGIMPGFAYWVGLEIHDPAIWESIQKSDFPVFTIEITGNTE